MPWRARRNPSLIFDNEMAQLKSPKVVASTLLGFDVDRGWEGGHFRGRWEPVQRLREGALRAARQDGRGAEIRSKSAHHKLLSFND